MKRFALALLLLLVGPLARDKVNAETNRALSDSGMLKRLSELGGRPIKGTPDDFGNVIKSETDKWAKVVIQSGAKAE